MYLNNKHFKEVLQDNNIDPREFDRLERLSSKAVMFSTGSRVLIVYVNTIVFIRNNKIIQLNTGGWETMTTKKWINYGLSKFTNRRPRRYIQQKDFKWYLITSIWNGDNYKVINTEDYKDNMKIQFDI